MTFLIVTIRLISLWGTEASPGWRFWPTCCILDVRDNNANVELFPHWYLVLWFNKYLVNNDFVPGVILDLTKRATAGYLLSKNFHSRKINNLPKFPRCPTGPSEVGAVFLSSLIALHSLPLCPLVWWASYHLRAFAPSVPSAWNTPHFA